MIAGSNLFLTASRLIARQDVLYWPFKSRGVNSIGFDIAEYDEPYIIKANIQAVQKDVYQQLGLDFQKRYFVGYFDLDVLDINRDVSGDQISFAGRQLQALSGLDWFHLDGWKSIVFVDIGERKEYYKPIGFEGEGFSNFDNGNFAYVSPSPFPETYKVFGFGEGEWGFEYGNFGNE